MLPHRSSCYSFQQSAALDTVANDEPEGASHPVCVPARHSTPPDEATESGGVQSPKDANELLQQTSGCESLGATVTPGGEANDARIAGDDGLGRISQLCADARKLVDEAISNSLVAIAAVVGEVAQGKLPTPELQGQPGQVERKEPPPEGTSFSGNDDDYRGKAKRPSSVDSRGERTTPVSASSVRTAVMENFLAGVYEIVSALRAAEEAKTRVVASVSASNDECSVKIATAADTNSTPDSVTTEDAGVVADEKTRDREESHPRPPPSPASLQAAAVVEDFVHDAYKNIAKTEAEKKVVKASTTSADRATESLSEDPIPIESETTGGVTSFDGAEDQAPQEAGAAASKEESAVSRTATAVENEGPPGGRVVDAGVNDERRTGVEPENHPSPPSSASLQAAVVEDFVSGTYKAVAISGGAEDRGLVSSEEPFPSGKGLAGSAVQPDSAEDQPVPVAGATAVKEESEVNVATTTTADHARTISADGGSPVDAEVAVEEKQAGCAPDDPNPRTSTPTRTAVVLDFLSGAYETVATRAAARAVGTPIALDLTIESLSKEVGEECSTRLDGTEDQARCLALASEDESPAEPAAIVIKEIIPIPTGSGMPPDAEGVGIKRTEDAPGERPGSSPLASLREAVVADFLSDAYSVVAMSRSSTTAATSVPSIHPESALLFTAEPATAVPDVDVAGENKGVSPSTIFAGDCPSEPQHTTTPLTNETAPEEKEGGNEEGEEKQAEKVTAATGAEIIPGSLSSDEPVISSALVVEEHLSDAPPARKAAEMEGTTAAAATSPADGITGAEGVQTPRGASPPRGLGAADGTQTVGKARDVHVDTAGEDNDATAAVILAMRCSIVEAMALVEQTPTTATIPGETCTKKKRVEEEEGGDTPDDVTRGDGLCSPTPPGTPEENRLDNGSPALDPEVPTDPAPVDGSRLPGPRSVEAFVYLSEAGARAKSRTGDLDRAQREAAEWLCLAAARAHSAQAQADKARVDASSWLRDRGARALQGRVHTAVGPLSFLKRRYSFCSLPRLVRSFTKCNEYGTE